MTVLPEYDRAGRRIGRGRGLDQCEHDRGGWRPFAFRGSVGKAKRPAAHFRPTPPAAHPFVIADCRDLRMRFLIETPVALGPDTGFALPAKKVIVGKASGLNGAWRGGA